MSGMEEDSNVSCIADLYGNRNFYAVTGVRTLTAIFALMCSLVVIFLICCYRKYEFTNQRLIMCLAAVSAFHSVVLAIVTPIGDVVNIPCLVLGFAEFYSLWVELLLIGCITLYLLLLVVYGRQLPYTVYIVVSFAMPLIWCFLPFINLSYGSSGPWCGIRIHRSNENCSLYTLGTVFRFALWQVPLYTIFLVFFVVCLCIVLKKLTRDSMKWEGAHYNPEVRKAKEKIIRQVKPFLFYPLVFVTLKVPLLLSQCYEVAHPEQPAFILWIFDALASPLGGAITALLYVCDATTLSKVGRCCRHCQCCYLTLYMDKGEEGFSRTRSFGSQVEQYISELDATFGDSMEGERARVARQKRRIEERLSGLRNATVDQGDQDVPQGSDNCTRENNGPANCSRQEGIASTDTCKNMILVDCSGPTNTALHTSTDSCNQDSNDPLAGCSVQENEPDSS